MSINSAEKRDQIVNSVGKTELARLLGWSRTRLDDRLESDGAFPVLRRKRGPGGFQFDPAAVASYLGVTLNVKPESDEKPGELRPGETRVESVALPPTAGEPASVPMRNSEETSGGARHFGEMTAKQRRDNAQALMLENKLRRESAELVDRNEVEMILATMLAHLGKGLDGLPDMIVKKLGLAEETADSIRALTDDLRVKMVGDLRSLFRDSEAEA